MTPVGARAALPSLQVCRGVAAVLVVLFHVSWNATAIYGRPFLGDALLFGHAAVDFFFVLSGFIILYAHHDDAARPRRAWRFVGARCARIFPAYWAVLALTLLVFTSDPELAVHARDPASRLRAVFLYDQLDRPVVAVAWTLSYELVFYAVFLVYVVLGRVAFGVAALVWTAVILASAGGALTAQAPILLSTLLIEFFLGCLAAEITLRLQPRVRGRTVVAAAALVLAVGIADVLGAIDTNANVRNFALPCFLLVLAAACHDRTWQPRCPRLLLVLGDASYSIYLVHYLVLFLFVRHAAAPAAVLGVESVLALLCVAMIAAGVAFHYAVERPLLGFLRAALGLSLPSARAATHAEPALRFGSARAAPR